MSRAIVQGQTPAAGGMQGRERQGLGKGAVKQGNATLCHGFTEVQCWTPD